MGYGRLKSQRGGYRSRFHDDRVDSITDAPFCDSTVSSREASSVAAKSIEPVSSSHRSTPASDAKPRKKAKKSDVPEQRMQHDSAYFVTYALYFEGD